MKALYKSIFLGVALLFGMASCDKDELPPTGPQDNAEILVQGTYVGEWTRELVGTDEVIKAPGSMIFSVSDKYSNNVSVITLDASGIDLKIPEPKTSVANITRLSSGDFTYWNQTAGNPFGVTFYGKVSPEGLATMTYTIIEVDEMTFTELEYLYSFSGQKQ